MRVVGFRSIYSGLKDPEMELNEETSKKLCEMLYQAHEPSDIGPHHGLGPTGYMVYWTWDDEMSKYPTVSMYVYRGIIEVSCFASRSFFKDTVGLEKFLEETLSPLEGIMPGTVLKQ